MSGSGATAGRRGGSLWNLLLAAGLIAVIGSLLLRTDDEPAAGAVHRPGPGRPGPAGDRRARDVDAPVVPIQVSSDAVLDPPRDAQDVGWWDGSAQPGARAGPDRDHRATPCTPAAVRSTGCPSSPEVRASTW